MDQKRVMEETGARGQLMQKYVRKTKTRFTPDFIADLHEYLLFRCQNLVSQSPKTGDSVLVADPHTGEKVRKQKALLCGPFRELHNQCIKHPDQGGFPGACDWSDPNAPSVPQRVARVTSNQRQILRTSPMKVMSTSLES